jgi:uncharacterized protein (TIGR02284 family)
VAVDELKKLHTALVDTRGAYEIAEKDTADPQVKRLCRDMVVLRRKDHEELHQTLVAAGEKPDDDGSFMSVVHETVVGVRAALTGISKKTLPAFASGEENIVELYDAAIREAGSNANALAILQRQRANLVSQIAEMKQLAS